MIAGTAKSKIYRAGVEVSAFEAEFFFLRETSVLLLGPSSWLDQAHPHYGE